MSRVITFSRVFPSYHPRAGEPTHFVYKVWKSFKLEHNHSLPEPFHEFVNDYANRFGKGSFEENWNLYHSITPKHHTIRAGHRWKVGDKFSPRVWSGIPYKSKQITFAPDIEVKKIFDFTIDGDAYYLNRFQLTYNDLEKLSRNDGLSPDDLECWFNVREFTGQIICWNNSIDYYPTLVNQIKNL